MTAKTAEQLHVLGAFNSLSLSLSLSRCFVGALLARSIFAPRNRSKSRAGKAKPDRQLFTAWSERRIFSRGAGRVEHRRFIVRRGGSARHVARGRCPQHSFDVFYSNSGRLF